MESIWDVTGAMPRFPSLRGHLDTDVLILGGGIAGLLCACRLQKAGVDCVLVEARGLCEGTTGHTTAKITAQHGLIYQKLGRKAALYYAANQWAVEEYARLCRDIDCDFSRRDAYVFSCTNRQKLEKEARALEALGAPVELVSETELPFPVAGAVRLGNQAQFHPLKFLRAIAGGLHIYTHTPVRQLVGTAAVTDHGGIRARRVVIATHFPILNKHGSYFMKMYQHRSYVLALQGAQTLEGMYVEEGKKGLSFRSDGDILLLGGGGHRTGKSGGNWQELRSLAREYYPQARELQAGAAQDCMTLDGIPYVGPYSADTQGLYVATGFNKWGMTGSMVAAQVLTDQLLGKESPYGALLSPSRSVLHPQLAANTGHALAGWLHLSRPRCPHLGCALNWNPREHSWDCSCHGSRFAGDGRLLEGPATGDLKDGQ